MSPRVERWCAATLRGTASTKKAKKNGTVAEEWIRVQPRHGLHGTWRIRPCAPGQRTRRGGRVTHVTTIMRQTPRARLRRRAKKSARRPSTARNHARLVFLCIRPEMSDAPGGGGAPYPAGGGGLKDIRQWRQQTGGPLWHALRTQTPTRVWCEGGCAIRGTRTGGGVAAGGRSAWVRPRAHFKRKCVCREARRASPLLSIRNRQEGGALSRGPLSRPRQRQNAHKSFLRKVRV